MKASKFVSELDRLYRASLVLVDGKARLQNVRKVPRFVKIAIVRHRAHLETYLAEGADVELDAAHRTDDELIALGGREILTEEILHEDGTVTQRWSWTSDEGDEHLDMILSGLLDAGEVIEQRKRAAEASREMEYSAAHPPKGRGLLGRSMGRIPGF